MGPCSRVRLDDVNNIISGLFSVKCAFIVTSFSAVQCWTFWYLMRRLLGFPSIVKCVIKCWVAELENFKWRGGPLFEFFGFLWGTSRLFLTATQFLLFGLVEVAARYGFSAYFYGWSIVEFIMLIFLAVLLVNRLKK